jgi:4-hydroxy-tetrahydrodipicolinate synthase
VSIEGINTAMVTPFDSNGRVNEDAAVRLMHHLLDNGSDGLVIAATTGEAPTLTDEEKLRLFDLAVSEVGDRATIVAGTGSNDTAHSVHLTEKAAEIGVDAVIAVTPYYNKPNRRGLVAHFTEIARAAGDVGVVLYNIPSRSVIDMPNDLLAELGQVENIVAVKQARYEDLAAIDGLDLLAGNDDLLAPCLDLGGPGGVTVSSHVVGTEMRRMIDEPDARQEIDEQLADVFKTLFIDTSPIPVKAAMNMLGHDVGGLRLPLVEASDEQKDAIRAMLDRHGLLSAV